MFPANPMEMRIRLVVKQCSESKPTRRGRGDQQLFEGPAGGGRRVGMGDLRAQQLARRADQPTQASMERRLLTLIRKAAGRSGSSLASSSTRLVSDLSPVLQIGSEVVSRQRKKGSLTD